jgi:hypothetical protein
VVLTGVQGRMFHSGRDVRVMLEGRHNDRSSVEITAVLQGALESLARDVARAVKTRGVEENFRTVNETHCVLEVRVREDPLNEASRAAR